MRSAPIAVFSAACSAAAIVAALTGCSGSGSGGSDASGPSGTGSAAAPASSTPSASAAAPASSAPAADAASITPERLCALVPVKEAAAAARTSPAITEQESGSFVHHEPECGYASADQKLIINVTIFNPAQTKVDLTHGVMSDAALTPVSGLGKSAAAGGPEVDVLFGDRALVVESFGSTAASLDQLQALAKVELSRLS
jgi:hypothetical protein